MLALTRPLYAPLASLRVHIVPPLLLHSLRFPQTKDSSPSGSYNVSACDKRDMSLSNLYQIPQKLVLIREFDSLLYLCTLSFHHQWWCHRVQEEEPTIQKKKDGYGPVWKSDPVNRRYSDQWVTFTNLSMKSSTACPAFTRRTMRRGFLSLDTMSWRDSAPITLVPLASFFKKSWTLDTVLLYAQTWERTTNVTWRGTPERN